MNSRRRRFPGTDLEWTRMAAAFVPSTAPDVCLFLLQLAEHASSARTRRRFNVAAYCCLIDHGIL